MTELQAYRTTEFAESVNQFIYLNHAGASPAPARVVNAVETAVRLSSSSPNDYFYRLMLPKMESARAQLAELMGVPAKDLALTKNTGHGLSIFADSIILSPGDNIVSADCEYPSVVYPWYAQADRGIETRLFHSRPDGTLSIEDAASIMDGRTRIVTLSWIQFCTGYRADLKDWVELAHSHNALLVIDVIQGLGVFTIHAEQMGIDVIATGVHKWLMAPGGVGGLYIAPHVLERMRLNNMGAASVVNVGKFDPLDFSIKQTAQRYEEGTPNGLGLIGLDAALSLIADIGVPRISEQVLRLGASAAELLANRGYSVKSPLGDKDRSGIVMFTHSKHSNQSIIETLSAAHVICAERGGYVRFSPHFYNTFDDLEIAVKSLP